MDISQYFNADYKSMTKQELYWYQNHYLWLIRNHEHWIRNLEYKITQCKWVAEQRKDKYMSMCLSGNVPQKTQYAYKMAFARDLKTIERWEFRRDWVDTERKNLVAMLQEVEDEIEAKNGKVDRKKFGHRKTVYKYDPRKKVTKKNKPPVPKEPKKKYGKQGVKEID